MEKKLLLALALICASFASSNGLSETSINPRSNLRRNPKTFSLFSIVQFPNMECIAGSSSSTMGTCLTASECTDKSGISDGNCAAGFGVCCVVTTSTCSSIVATNITYVQNANYPSGTLPTAASTCTYTVNKVNDNICQLRLDFATMSGFATKTTPGICNDKVTVTGMSGYNPPEICGTNTGYHMYAEFGAKSTDVISMVFTYNDLTATKMFNILLKQIPCDAEYKAPTDCVQYFTGITGSVANYGHGSGDLLHNQQYTNCIRTEVGMCGISWHQAVKTGSGSETFKLSQTTIANEDAMNIVRTEVCDPQLHMVITIPSMSYDGISTLPLVGTVGSAAIGTALNFGTTGLNQGFISYQCGTRFGAFGINDATNKGQLLESATAILQPERLVSRVQPFTVGVVRETNGGGAVNDGFRLEYTQVPCG